MACCPVAGCLDQQSRTCREHPPGGKPHIVALKPCYGGYILAAWLAAIVINLLTLSGYYDIALRDFGLMLGALTLARLAPSVTGWSRRCSGGLRSASGRGAGGSRGTGRRRRRPGWRGWYRAG